MKKRFFLLFVLALVFIMSLSFGSVALADTEPTDENAVYASKWKTSTGVKVTKEEGSGGKNSI